jgi:hypothetical protein
MVDSKRLGGRQKNFLIQQTISILSEASGCFRVHRHNRNIADVR